MGFFSKLFGGELSSVKSLASLHLNLEDTKELVRFYFKNRRPVLFYAQLFGYRHDTVIEEGFFKCSASEPKDILDDGLDFAMATLRSNLDLTCCKSWKVFRNHYVEVLDENQMAWLDGIVKGLDSASLARAFDQHDTEIRSFALGLVQSLRDIDLGNIKHKIDAKWVFLKPLLRNSLLAGVDKYGEQNYQRAFDECRDFAEKFLPDTELKFTWSSSVWWDVFRIADRKLEEESLLTVDDVPSEGVEFEHWCARRFDELGWTTRITSVSGDQGVDIIAIKGDVIVAIQCKRYSQPVGNAAVQEIYAGKQYASANYACVISTAGYTKSAKELARSTGVYLIGHDEIDSFSDHLLEPTTEQ